MRFSTAIFLSENSFYPFGVDLDRIDLVDSIQRQEIREQLKAAIFRQEEKYAACIQEVRKAYDRLVEVYKLNLVPGWHLACRIDPYGLFCFHRLAFIGGPHPKQQEIAFEKGCAFCCDFLIEAVIKIEQTMSPGELTEYESLLRELDEREAALRHSEV